MYRFLPVLPAVGVLAAALGAQPAAPPRAAAPTQVRVVAINDFHGAFEPREDGTAGLRGGAAHLATAVKRAAQECAPACVTVVVDAGDELQGTPASNLAYGAPAVRFLNQLGVAGAALGNHEFDWGVDTLRARVRQAAYAIMAANVTDAAGRAVPWLRADTIVVRGGVRIGLVGIAGQHTPRTTMPRHVAALRFRAPASVLDRHIRSLRERGAQVVVVLAHDGGFCNGRGGTDPCRGEVFEWGAELTERPDLIVSGHTHSLVNARVNGIPVVQARSNGRAVAVVDLPLDGGTARAEVRPVIPDELPADDDAQALVRRALDDVSARVSAPMGRAPRAIRRRAGDDGDVGNLLADAFREAGNADFALMNDGGIRADIPAGPVTYGSFFEVAPFANQLYRIRIAGADLRRWLERQLSRGGAPRWHVAGFTATYDLDRPSGSRLVHLRLADGRAVDDAAEYTLVLSDFLLAGGDGGALAGRQAPEPLNLTDLDAVIAWARRRPDALITADGALRLVPESRP